jgi:hypothetical protein
LGSLVYSVSAPITVTLQGGAGLAYIYVSSSGSVTVGTSLTGPSLNCSGCQLQSAITQFPVDAIPLASWNATAGAWDSTGMIASTAISVGRNFTAGQNVTLLQSGSNVMISADSVNTAANFIWTGAHMFNGNVTSGPANNVDLSASMVSLPSVFVRTDKTWTMNNGQKGTFGLSGATAGARLTCGALPSVQLTGDLICDAVGVFGKNDGTNADAFVSVAGSGSSYATPPTPGLFLQAAANFHTTGVNLSGDVTTSNSASTTIAANAVTAAKSAVVLTRRTCSMVVGADNGSALANADIGPQKKRCKIPSAATVVEVSVSSDAGTPSVIAAVRHCTTFTTNVCSAETVSNLVANALSTATGGFDACSNSGGTTGLDTGTTCSATLQNTSAAAGDYFELVSGTAGGTARRLSVSVVYTVN